jgi:hypothetical protein
VWSLVDVYQHTSETLVSFYETTQGHIIENGATHSHHRENTDLNSVIFSFD